VDTSLFILRYNSIADNMLTFHFKVKVIYLKILRSQVNFLCVSHFTSFFVLMTCSPFSSH
jgi:hypothetical protein